MELDSSSCRIRRAGAADADEFAEQRIRLLASASRPIATVEVEHLRRETRESFVDLLRRERCIAWFAEERDGAIPGAILGSTALVLVNRLPSLPNPLRLEGYLAHLFVEPTARRRGVGSALLRAALDEARRRRLVRLRLHSTKDGLLLYERFGFRARANDLELFIDRDAPN